MLWAELNLSHVSYNEDMVIGVEECSSTSENDDVPMRDSKPSVHRECVIRPLKTHF